MKLLLFFVLIINLCLLNSCKKYVPSDGAFFIKPNMVAVSTSTPQGSGSHNITDLWLYVNGKFQGAYPTGNLMPIISKNTNVKINIFAGIKNNGIGTTRLSYIMYDFLTLDTLVENGKTVDRTLTFKYNPNTTFAWIENFSSNGISLIKSPGYSDTMRIIMNSDSFEGASAAIDLTGKVTNAVAQYESAASYTLPTGSSNVYLEVNYKTNQGFEVGLLAGTTRKDIAFVNPTDSWNKIYIQLADAINREPTASSYKVYFKMVKTVDNASPKMFLDNIKLVYLQ